MTNCVKTTLAFVLYQEQIVGDSRLTCVNLLASKQALNIFQMKAEFKSPFVSQSEHGTECSVQILGR